MKVYQIHKIAATMIILILLLPGCSNKSKTVGDLIEYFRNKYIEGKYIPHNSRIGRAYGGPKRYMEGGMYQGKKSSLFIYKYKNEDIPGSLGKSGIRDMSCFANGYFVMCIRNCDIYPKVGDSTYRDWVIEVFKKF